MKLKHPLLKRTGSFILICALILSSFLISNVRPTSAATDLFHKNSITSKSWSSIKPKVRKWIQRQVPYASPCSYLIDWKSESAEGLDCSGFVNAMVHLYYEDGHMQYDWPSFFSSDTWSYELTKAGLRRLGSDRKEDFARAYKSGRIQDGDIVVFSDELMDAVHVALIYGKDKKNEVLLAHEYGNHLQTTPFSKVYDWDFGGGTYAYYEVFAGTPRKITTARTQKDDRARFVSYKKLKRHSQQLSLRSKPKKNIRKTYRLAGVTKKAKKYIRVSKNGIVKIRKGLRKGGVKFHVKVTTYDTKRHTSYYEIKTVKLRIA